MWIIFSFEGIQVSFFHKRWCICVSSWTVARRIVRMTHAPWICKGFIWRYKWFSGTRRQLMHVKQACWPWGEAAFPGTLCISSPLQESLYPSGTTLMPRHFHLFPKLVPYKYMRLLQPGRKFTTRKTRRQNPFITWTFVRHFCSFWYDFDKSLPSWQKILLSGTTDLVAVGNISPGAVDKTSTVKYLSASYQFDNNAALRRRAP